MNYNIIKENVVRFEKEYFYFLYHPFGEKSYEIEVKLTKVNFFCEGNYERRFYSDDTIDTSISYVPKDILTYDAVFNFHDCTGYTDSFVVLLRRELLEDYNIFRSLFMKKFLETYEKYIKHWVEKRTLINLKNILFENINNTSK